MADLPRDLTAIAASEDELRLVADSAPVHIWVTRSNGKRSFVNRAYREFLGLSFEAACDADWHDYVHPDDIDRLLRLEAANHREFEARYLRADGAWRWLHSVSRPRFDAEGRHIGFVGVAHDITEAKQAEIELREREQQYAAFINQATVGFAQVDLTGMFTLVNDRFCEIAGWSREELLERTMQSITHPDDLGRNLPLFEQAVRDGTPYAHEKRYIRKDGGIVWVNNSVSVIRRPGGTPYGVLAVTLDVTARRAAEQALRTNAESMRLAVESAGMATWGLDVASLEGEWSPNHFDLLGMPRPADLVGSFDQWIDRAHFGDRELARHRVMRCIHKGLPFTLDYRIHRADTGAERWLQSHGSRVDYDDDRASRFVCISFDITERKHAEQELRASAESLRLAIEGSAMSTWELELGSLEGQWSPNRFDLLGMPRTADLRGSFEDWLLRVHPEDRQRAYATATRCFSAGEPYTMEYRIHRADDGEERWVQGHGSRIDYGDERASRFVGISFDITERKRAEEELRASEARFRSIFEEANDFLITTTLDQRITAVNPAVLAALDYREEEVIGRSIGDFMDPEQFEIARAALARKLAEGGNVRITLQLRTRDGQERIWEINTRITNDADGTPHGLHAIARDVTEAKRAETHLRLLVDELNHRVKNTLAIVQGIIQQTFRSDRAPELARAAFEGRLAALSEAHSLLTREHWGPVSMASIISDAVAPHAGETQRIDLSGPNLQIAPKTAISLALAIHELATNAVKYGALARPEGSVEIDWQIADGPEGRRMHLEWQEHGGPPVEPPSHRGFGTRMIERGLAAELGGSVRIDFAPEGVRCTVDAPLPVAA
jgi:PAS domain S-box-containing protein